MNELNYFLNWTWREKKVLVQMDAQTAFYCFVLLLKIIIIIILLLPLSLSLFIWCHFISSKRKEEKHRPTLKWNGVRHQHHHIISPVHYHVDLTRLLEGRPTRQDDISEQHFLDDDHDDDCGGGADVFPEFTLSTFSFFFTFCQLNVSSFLDDGKVDGLLANNIPLCVKVFIFIPVSKPLAFSKIVDRSWAFVLYVDCECSDGKVDEEES